MQIIITTHRVQNRRHKKKRINKKWAKRYGFTETNIQEDGHPIIVGGRGTKQIMYMTLNDFNKLADSIERGKYGDELLYVD